MTDIVASPIQVQISKLFEYKAEWMEGRLFDLFTEPAYFAALTTARPCVLIGGRGTGKTTVLRALSYEGQFALQGQDVSSIGTWDFIGLYIRIKTDRVRTFYGPERTPEEWDRLFGHYLNLRVCLEALTLCQWYEELAGAAISMPPKEFDDLKISLRQEGAPDLGQLLQHTNQSVRRFQNEINDIADTLPTGLTALGAPIETVFQTLSRSEAFMGKTFFVLLDEYENFLNYQQRIVNTLLKHAEPPYTFKIGVRELGWRDRSVIGGSEKVTSPADYERIDIGKIVRGEVFRDFAVRVCNERLARLDIPGDGPLRDVRQALPSMSLEEEANEFGARKAAAEVLEELSLQFTAEQLAPVRGMSPLQVYLFRYWAQATGSKVQDMFADYLHDPRKWDTRYINYKYAAVFTLRRGRRGINKYYAGWDTFVRMAAGNIRYFVMLVEASLVSQFSASRTLSTPVPPRVQTAAAQEVGRATIDELEGVDVLGAKLTRLVLSLGRIFQVLAKHPSGHAPEVNQFYLREDDGPPLDVADVELAEEVQELLNAAVTHLALLRSPGTKLLDEASIRQHDYMLHPIFSAFFEFSHRRKRKMQLFTSELWGLVNFPRRTVRAVLDRNRRITDDEFPDQLLLFEPYYDDFAS